MRVLIYIFATALILSMTSCEDFFETTLELEEPEFESQLGLSAVFNSNEYDRRVLLTQTVGLNEKDLRNKVVEQADIKLTEPNGAEHVFSLINGAPVDGYSHIVNTPTFTEEGLYSISASTPDGRSLSSEVTLLPEPKVSSAVFVAEGSQDEYGNKKDAIDITIDDEAGVENFYKIVIESITSNSSIRPEYISSLDPSTSESAIYNALLTSDAQYDGSQYKIRVVLDFDSNVEKDKYIISISNISKDQHRFDKILESARENEDNPFTSPVQLHTNMTGGIGLFAIERMIEIEVEK